VSVAEPVRVYDSHPSSSDAAFRMESISLEIIIGTYLVMVQDGETLLLQWMEGLTHISR
jgi:hypothetical protein